MAKVSVIKLGGEDYEICFNNHSLIFIAKAIGCDPLQVEKQILSTLETNPLRGLTYLIYGGICGRLESKAVFKHDITLAFVSEKIGEANIDEFDIVWEMFRETMLIPKATEEQIAEYRQALEEQKKKK